MGRLIAGVVAFLLLAVLGGCSGREPAPTADPTPVPTPSSPTPSSPAPSSPAPSSPAPTPPFDYCAAARDFSARFGGLFLVPMLDDPDAAEDRFAAFAERAPRPIRRDWRRVRRGFGALADGVRRSGLSAQRYVAAHRGDTTGLTARQARIVRRAAGAVDRVAVAAAERRAVDDVRRACGVNLYRRS
ncbi:hypothetical protein [Nocardioides nitrophenolicus]|uniref:hypothetical protein n=1 Tax=Nocardioides nitrophenolicus TaxID=60489 RepID=UPI001957E20F|nr:hypothetical protein [Nocardioides nitrophenolicus]MBM7519096.1 hypothetical protein [Nocardioides nitrophenolicus]